MNMGEMVSAQAAFEKVLELDPSRATAHCQLGMILVSRLSTKEAIQHLEKYLELDPEGSRRRPGGRLWRGSSKTERLALTGRKGRSTAA